MARRSFGRAFASDAVLREQLIGSVAATIRADGSAADFPATALAVLDLIDLDAPSSRIQSSLDWLIAQANRPGAFGEGCTAARHAHRVCEHAVGGFFSPAPPSQRAAPASMPNGKVYRVESQARFAASCLALTAVLRAGRAHEPAVQRHLDSFSNLQLEWETWGDFLVPDLAFNAIAALAVAPERWQPTLEAMVRLAGNQQLHDGTWPRVDFFNALDGLCRANHPLVGPILEQALPGLLQRQRDDGSFGNVAADERALVGLRVLERVKSPPPEPARTLP